MALAVVNICALVVAVIDLVMATLCFSRHTKEGLFLGCALILAILDTAFYCASLNYVDDMFIVSLCSSAYFSCTMLICLSFYKYTTYFTHYDENPKNRVIFRIACLYAILDLAFMLTNPITGISVSYTFDANAFIPHWVYTGHLAFNLHLLFSYLLVGASLANLAVKSYHEPKIYRRRYMDAFYLVIIIVLLNAVFLFLPQLSIIDFSILLYSVTSIVLYLHQYHFADQQMEDSTSQLAFDRMDSMAVIFDHENQFLLCNRAAYDLIPSEKRLRSYTLAQFAHDVRIDRNFVAGDVNRQIQWTIYVSGKPVVMRCTVHALHDESGFYTGRLLMFSPEAYETDLLTGFYTKASFESAFDPANANPPVTQPAAVVVCDLNRLNELNHKLGYETGDKAIRLLSKLLQVNFPRETKSYFVRLDEAALMVVAPSMHENDARARIAQARKQLQFTHFGEYNMDMQYSLSMADEKNPSILQAARSAYSAMVMSKMLDYDSAHSSLLASLVKTQQQSDGETKEHVHRTREMGRLLGERLHLSDMQQNSLALLCLLHDIGKVGIPVELLNKPTRLTDAEWEMIKTHTSKGYEIASASTELQGIAPLILHHHENWDGTGYPDGLRGEAIPLLSRVLAVVDTFDAMTHDRPYCPGRTVEEAAAEIKRCAGTQFDPLIVSEFLQMIADNPDLVKSDADGQTRTFFDTQAGPLQNVQPSSLETATADAATSTASGERHTTHSRGAYGVNSSDEMEAIAATPLFYGRYLLQENARIVDANDAFTQITGYTKQDLKDYELTQLDLIFPEDKVAYMDAVAKLSQEGKELYLEHRLRCKNGSERYVLCLGRYFFDSALLEKRSEIIIIDATRTLSTRALVENLRQQLEKSVSQWERRAQRDRATGLLNKPSFSSTVQEKLLNDNATTLLLMLDLDHFKEYNDEYGHPEGDVLINVYARAMREAMGKDGIAGRVGGDEFAACFTFEDHPDAEVLREKTKAIWELVSSRVNGYAPTVTVSLGAAILADEAISVATFNELYSLADDELYRAKEQGRNQFCCNF